MKHLILNQLTEFVFVKNFKAFTKKNFVQCGFVFLIFILPTFSFGQRKILVKDIISGETRKLKKGKAISLISVSDTIYYEYKDKSTGKYWLLKNFTDSSLTIEYKKSSELKTYAFRNIKNISFKRNESEGNPGLLIYGGIFLMVASPLTGITKDGYDLNGVKFSFTAGAGLFSFAYLYSYFTRHRELLDYEIIGTK
ncbi:MAG: hypothetical protein SFY56_16150 [Bacteroidota bacterium]|nr:hypothetical protein [Bacteroidota bacterium]